MTMRIRMKQTMKKRKTMKKKTHPPWKEETSATMKKSIKNTKGSTKRNQPGMLQSVAGAPKIKRNTKKQLHKKTSCEEVETAKKKKNRITIYSMWKLVE